jgi:sigma-B regulation protein RsbU (phosphoserine phosphatase)
LQFPRDHHVLHRIVRPDGRIRWVEGHGRPQLDAHGALIGLTGVSTDVTDREQLLANLAEHVELTRQALADKSRVAETLERSLRPERLPEIEGLDLAAGFRPGEDIVGGDFYDAFQHGDSWYVYIGDVCGHGPSAAAQTGLARNAIRGLVAAGIDEPSDILAKLNQLLLAGPTERFVSLVLARITLGSPVHITLCRAGHPLPIVRTSTGSTCLLDLVPGSLLGLTPSVELSDQSITLGSGDALVLYTDGVTEARRGLELLGEDRLVDSVERGPSEAGRLVHHVLDTVKRFQDRPPSDDLAIVAVVAR